ncbi:hypothetical protein ACFL96_11445 [Thermoproteota archaeon]
MKQIISIGLSFILLFSIFNTIPIIFADSPIVVFVEEIEYVAGDSVYVFGQLEYPFNITEQVSIIVASPSGKIWKSLSTRPDSEGRFGVTLGIISSLDSTGTYLVSARYYAFTNQTTFQVRTPQTLEITSDKEIYLADEIISFSGHVSPVIDGYQVTIRIGIDTFWIVGQSTPLKDGSFTLNNFYKVQPDDNDIWTVEASYGPFSETTFLIYVGAELTITSDKSEYVPGQTLNITGSISPSSPGSVVITIKNPSGGIFYNDTAPIGDGTFGTSTDIFPGDQTGIYSVSVNFLGVTNTSTFVIGRLDSSVMEVSGLSLDGSRYVRSGSLINVTVSLTNLDIVSHDFIFIIQISDSSGKIWFITSQSHNILPDEIIYQNVGTPSISEKGIYTVKAFVWDNWENPNVLSNIHSFPMVIW